MAKARDFQFLCAVWSQEILPFRWPSPKWAWSGTRDAF